MDYKRIHDMIIEKAKTRKLEGYKEKHHIIPKSFGGDNSKENIVELTAREHFIIHRILSKIYPDTGMVHAVFKMSCVQPEKYKVTSRVYEYLRRKHAEKLKVCPKRKQQTADFFSGKKQSEEHVRKRIESRKKNGPWHNHDTIEKISISNTGKKGTWAGKELPKELVIKRNNSRRENGNYKWTEEQKNKVSISKTGVSIKKPPLTDDEKLRLTEQIATQTVCPHCNKNGGYMIMKRWHFDNCKERNKNVYTSNT